MTSCGSPKAISSMSPGTATSRWNVPDTLPSRTGTSLTTTTIQRPFRCCLTLLTASELLTRPPSMLTVVGFREEFAVILRSLRPLRETGLPYSYSTNTIAVTRRSAKKQTYETVFIIVSSTSFRFYALAGGPPDLVLVLLSTNH